MSAVLWSSDRSILTVDLCDRILKRNIPDFLRIKNNVFDRSNFLKLIYQSKYSGSFQGFLTNGRNPHRMPEPEKKRRHFPKKPSNQNPILFNSKYDKKPEVKV